jgi:hypothetical protein
VIPLAEEPIIDAVLRELRGDIWRRGHVKDDKPQQWAIDRAAAAKALAIASAGDILAGGWKWRVAFEAGDGLRYLPELHVWLAMRGWEKPPPTKQAKRAMRSDAPRATSAGSSVAYALQSMARGQS